MISDYFNLEFGQLLLAEQCKQKHSCMNTALQAKEAYCKALEELYIKVCTLLLVESRFLSNSFELSETFGTFSETLI